MSEFGKVCERGKLNSGKLKVAKRVSRCETTCINEMNQKYKNN